MSGENAFCAISHFCKLKWPHLIVVGKGIIIDDDTVAFFGWRQGATSRNIENNGIIQIVVVLKHGTKDIEL